MSVILNKTSTIDTNIKYSEQLKTISDGIQDLKTLVAGIEIPEGFDDTQIIATLNGIKASIDNSTGQIVSLRTSTLEASETLRQAIEQLRADTIKNFENLLDISRNSNLIKEDIISSLTTVKAQIVTSAGLIVGSIDAVASQLGSWQMEQRSHLTNISQQLGPKEFHSYNSEWNRADGECTFTFKAGFSKLFLRSDTTPSNIARKDIEVTESGKSSYYLNTGSEIIVDDGPSVVYPSRIVKFPALVNGVKCDSERYWIEVSYREPVENAIIKNAIPHSGEEEIVLPGPDEPEIGS